MTISYREVSNAYFENEWVIRRTYETVTPKQVIWSQREPSINFRRLLSEIIFILG